jgi:hypothetical protein
VLSAEILKLADSLTEPERDNLKLMLGMAAGELILTSKKSGGDQYVAAFEVVASCLAGLQAHRDRVLGNGVAWRGSPNFMTPTRLEALRLEANANRADAIKHDQHFLACGGRLADELAVCADLVALVKSSAGPVRATGTASYIYYDIPGQNICPHIDTDVFSINAILMLRHDYSDDPKSFLEIYPQNQPCESILLIPGEMIIFWADSVVHARSSVGLAETVNILTIGFQPTESLPV